VNSRWKQKKNPASLEAKFEFEEYDVLRTFLDDLADVAEKLDHHPNLSFGRTHVSAIIYSTGDELRDVDIALAEGIDECFHRVTD
jgi:pterin-4a-carbinolamine dehydratase